MSRAIGLILLLLCFPVSASTLYYVGTASHPETGKVIYTEAYTDQLDEQGKLTASTVDYRYRNDSVLARKTLDFRRHPYVPAFDFHNQASGYRESLHWLADGRIRLRHQDAGEDSQERILRVPEPAVADAGFNPFIRAHLKQLEAGTTLRFHFINPARLDWFAFTARMIASDSQGITVKVAPASRLLRWLVSPIELVYARDGGYLLQYRGLTNISLEKGDTINAHITYRYQDSRDTALLPDANRLEYRPTPSEG